MLLTILLAVFGLVGVVKGEFNLTKNRRVGGQMGRILGVALLIAAVISFFTTSIIPLVILVGVIVVGFITAEKV